MNYDREPNLLDFAKPDLLYPGAVFGCGLVVGSFIGTSGIIILVLVGVCYEYRGTISESIRTQCNKAPWYNFLRFNRSDPNTRTRKKIE